MTDTPPAKSPGLLSRLARARPTKPGVTTERGATWPPGLYHQWQ